MLVIVRTAAITVAFPVARFANPEGARFTYAEGALHSADDEPALTVCSGRTLSRIGLERYHESPLLFVRLTEQPREVKWLKYHLQIKRAAPDIARENRWYDRGELHRNFGPAVAGHILATVGLERATIEYWIKYDRGVFGAGTFNAFETDGAEFGCVPGAMLCASTQCILATPNIRTTETTRVYRAGSMRVVSANRCSHSFGNLASTPLIQCVKLECTGCVQTVHHSAPLPLDECVLIGCATCDPPAAVAP